MRRKMPNSKWPSRREAERKKRIALSLIATDFPFEQKPDGSFGPVSSRQFNRLEIAKLSGLSITPIARLFDELGFKPARGRPKNIPGSTPAEGRLQKKIKRIAGREAASKPAAREPAALAVPKRLLGRRLAQWQRLQMLRARAVAQLKAIPAGKLTKEKVPLLNQLARIQARLIGLYHSVPKSFADEKFVTMDPPMEMRQRAEQAAVEARADEEDALDEMLADRILRLKASGKKRRGKP